MNDPNPANPARLNIPCIGVDLYPFRRMTVAQYDEIQRMRLDQPLWGRTAPAVEELTEEPARWGWGARILDRDAYNAQMRHLIGLD